MTERPLPSNEQILISRASMYEKIYLRFQENIRLLKEEHGGWKNIPGKLKRKQFRNLRLSGFIYENGKWSPPNSVDLSSLQ